MSTVVFSSCEDDEEDELGADTCYTCKGTGKIKGNVCPTCLGSGELGDSDSSSDDEDDDDKIRRCSYCKGTGNCQSCHGNGYHYTISVDVPCSTCKTTGKCHLCNGLGYIKK
ncbi:MAG: hypothetical protein PUD99_07885 [Turicibacter sp.]|nr:hypothetical protein [Turicibacter sp.]